MPTSTEPGRSSVPAASGERPRGERVLISRFGRAAAAVVAIGTAAALVAIGLRWSDGHRIRVAERAIEEGRPDQAVTLLAPLARSDEPRVIALLARARIAQGRPIDAARLLEARLRRRDEASWLGLLGEAYEAAEMPGRAIPAYEAYLLREPDDVDALGRLADLAARGGSPVEASSLLDRLERLEPTSPEWPRRHGLLLLQTDRYDAAAEALGAAVALDPDETETRFLLAEAQFLAGQVERSVAHLDACLERDRDDRYLLAHAECLRALGDPEAAAAEIAEVLDRSPGDPRALRLSAELCLERGDHPRALELLERALEADPDDWRVHYQLSIVYARLGRGPEARHHADRMRAEQDRSRRSLGF